MAYCTIDELKEALPEKQLIRLTDYGDEEISNALRYERAINSAAEEIDTYLASRYDLPVSPVPPILVKFNIDIAIYNLYSAAKDAMPETRRDRYQNAIRFLEKVADGKISLGVQPPPDPPDEGDYGGSSQVSSRPKVFDATTMDKY